MFQGGLFFEESEDVYVKKKMDILIFFSNHRLSLVYPTAGGQGVKKEKDVLFSQVEYPGEEIRSIHVRDSNSVLSR